MLFDYIKAKCTVSFILYDKFCLEVVCIENYSCS